MKSILNLSGSTFKHITVKSRLGGETKIQEKIIRKFMKLARSKEAKKLFEKDPCKIFTDRFILVRNQKNLAKTYSYKKCRSNFRKFDMMARNLKSCSNNEN